MLVVEIIRFSCQRIFQIQLFEVALYNINKETISENITTNVDDSKCIYKGKEVDKALYAMLDDKAQAAYILASREVNLKIPGYIDKAIEWLRR